MKIHAIQTGWIRIKAAIHDGRAYRLRHLPRIIRSKEFETIPTFSYLVEHNDGHIVIDTGMSHNLEANWPRLAKGLASVSIREDEEVGPGLRRVGLSPDDVRLLVPTHLHPDHGGGLGHFPLSEILVHRPERDFSRKWYARPLYRPQDLPSWYEPRIYDLSPERYGPFPESLEIARGVRLIRLPGHSIGQVGVALEDRSVTILFTGDHSVRQSTFVRDGTGKPKGTIYPHYKHAIVTQQRLAEFVRSRPTVLIPAHDTESPVRLRSLETVTLDHPYR